MRPEKTSQSGQTLIEFALLLPLLFWLVINVVNFGAFCYTWVTVSNAARAGVVYLARGAASAGAPVPPTAAAVKNLLNGTPTAELASLPHYSDVNYTKIYVYGKNIPGADGVGPADLEDPTLFVDCSVTVQYKSVPLIKIWRFPALNIDLTWPPSAGLWVNRTATTRMMQ